MSPIENQIEAVLFYRGEPTSINHLSELIGCGKEEILDGIGKLKENLAGRGIVLLEHDGSVMLGTSKNTSKLIENLVKEELHRDLGRAGLETLSIILYQGPVRRSDIDYIRGVNSTFILRNLLIRGLIQKTENENDKRSFLYKPTFDLFSFMGISSIEELPEYESVRKEIELKKQAQEDAEKREKLEEISTSPQ